MKTLQTEFISGDGGFSANPLTYKQLARNQNYAIYERSRDGEVKDYEVFKIRILPKGHKIFAKILEDDEEQYPSTGQFGVSAWSFGGKFGLERAMNRYKSLNNKSLEEPVKKAKITLPAKPKWTMLDLLAVNPSRNKANLYLEVQDLIKEKVIKKVGVVETADGPRKPNLYSKI
jgi:hypothetical protein